MQPRRGSNTLLCYVYIACPIQELRRYGRHWVTKIPSHRTQQETWRGIFKTGTACFSCRSCLASFCHAATGAPGSHPFSSTAKWALWLSSISRFWCGAHKIRKVGLYSSLEESNQTSNPPVELSLLILKGVWPGDQTSNAACFPAIFLSTVPSNSVTDLRGRWSNSN